MKNKTIVLMGQSNAVYFSQYGGTDALAVDLQLFAPGKVTFIQCAKGGTILNTDWMPGQTLYQACLEKIGTQTIDLILWDQGESEAEGGSVEMCNDWGMNLVMMMASFRAALHNPQIPVLHCRLPDDLPWQLPRIKEMYFQTDTVRVPYGHLVDLNGIKSDQLHYIPDNGYVKVAQRYANAYKLYLQGE